MLHARTSDHSERLQARVDRAAHAISRHHVVPVQHRRGLLVGPRLGLLHVQLRMGQVAVVVVLMLELRN